MTQLRQGPYLFARAIVGHGPALAVRLRETGQTLGYVRRIEQPSERGLNWMIYNTAGDEIAIADLRSSAATLLERYCQ